MIKIGFIGGTGTHGIIPGTPVELDTLYGRIQIILSKTKPKIIYVPRHGLKQNIPSYMVNYKAIIDALRYHGVKYTLATTLATRLRDEYGIGDIVIVSDIIDLTTMRQKTLDPNKVLFTDMRKPFSEKLRKILYEILVNEGFNVYENGVAIVVDGPRHETPSEAKMYRLLGGDLISMSLAPEAFMAKEAGIEYAAIAFIVNDPADKGYKRKREEIMKIIEPMRKKLLQIILRVGKELDRIE